MTRQEIDKIRCKLSWWSGQMLDEGRTELMQDLMDAHQAMTVLMNKAGKRIKRVKRLLEKQTLDEGLWFVAETAPEAYLQQELRKLSPEIEELLIILTSSPE